MKLAVVILNWNGQSLLEQFLPTIIQYSPEATIYVADNASTDNSVAYVKANFPSVKIIINKDNYGFAGGYNEALQNVDADLYALVNSDIEVTANWLEPIIETFKNEPKTAIIQPKILDFKNKEYFEYAGAAGGFIDKYGFPFCRGRIFDTLEKDNGQYDNSIEIFWASGACFFIVRDGKLITPPNDNSLESITQATVIELAADMGIEVVRRRISREEVYIADEAFFTGTAAEITPIRDVDARVIGCGSRGPITEKIQSAYFDVVAGKNEKYIKYLTYVN